MILEIHVIFKLCSAAMKPVTQHDRNLEHLTDDLGDHSLHQLQRSDFYNLLNCLFIITQVAEIHRPACCPASSSIQLRCVHIVIKGLVSWQHSYIIVCSFWDQSLIHAEGSSKFSDIRRMLLIKTFCSTQLSCAGDEQYRSPKTSLLTRCQSLG